MGAQGFETTFVPILDKILPDCWGGAGSGQPPGLGCSELWSVFACLGTCPWPGLLLNRQKPPMWQESKLLDFHLFWYALLMFLCSILWTDAFILSIHWTLTPSSAWCWVLLGEGWTAWSLLSWLYITAGDRPQDSNNHHSGIEPKQHALMRNTGDERTR